MNGNSSIFRQDRVTFFSGQRLTAGDLNMAQDVNQTMRWLHNSSQHNWGIGFGLAVVGETGTREVTVGLGYALDAMGREIVLAEAQTLPVPPLAGENGEPAERDLTIAYRTEDEDVETREGVCLPRGAVRLSTAPVIRWLETAQVRNGFDIVLARAKILNCQLGEPLSLTQRRNARLTQQPYIAAGQTSPGQTNWEPWIRQNITGADIVMGYQTAVDTAIARFRVTPRYLARVAGERLAPPFEGLSEDSFLVEGFTNVVEARPDGFTAQVLMVPRGVSINGNGLTLNPDNLFDSGNIEAAKDVLQDIWHMVWIGIEG